MTVHEDAAVGLLEELYADPNGVERLGHMKEALREGAYNRQLIAWVGQTQRDPAYWPAHQVAALRRGDDRPGPADAAPHRRATRPGDPGEAGPVRARAELVVTTVAPLDDLRYEAKHPPVDGRIPDVVAKWGPRSQVRWFRRFRGQVGAQPVAVWDAHYCTSEHHRGQCCDSCQQEYLDGYHGGGVMVDGWCCCYDERMGR